ncbi:Methionine ABC transporter ATP-binding protein [Dickeya aquatica]|uniref:Cell division ATP-binding protein FtsE n=1 Tax=Dickeya aquatica TaxID=1401087 RepID=A0A375A9C9_9GAMM|nr:MULTISPECIES: ATP-binding cassette domain-containing protein [Dickeya]SLM62526.1 Methionine ABC transporter ATP-binding protein [Dickeya aquatica]
MIQIERLAKRYPDSTSAALEEVSLTIPTGAIYGILGRSGAGKSTLIRCLNLLERPTSGRIVMDGCDITTLSAAALRQHRQRTGMIFQHFNLLHARTVQDNVAVPLEIAGVARHERETRVAELLALVGLSDKAQAYPSQLSGGQKQRVGIARALAARPRYLLCDEATSALDPQTTASILALLKQINQQLGLTVVLITHELEVVKTLCDHAALLEAGRVVESGELRVLLANPTSRLRQALLPDLAAERAFLLRHGVELAGLSQAELALSALALPDEPSASAAKTASEEAGLCRVA